MFDEKGYVQFRSDWQHADPPRHAVVEDLIRWRERLYRLGLIGVYPDGIGFGNLSGRTHGHAFIITGTGTGQLATLTPAHFCTVTAFAIAENHVTCVGPVQASSEAMSHAAVYVADPTAGVVLHVHHWGLWEKLSDRIPTTDPHAEAGTPAMGAAITQLLEVGVPGGVFIMGGHREGIMAYGTTADQAGERILQLFETHGCR
ncbi:MAG: class II aldolase/adducin family protein [Bacteroidales bacterium]|nr:class II aldolase/adducin family protein [Bacteroidales bacterium]